MWLDKSCCILPRLGVIDGTGHHPRLPDIISLIIIFSVYFLLFIFKALGSHYFVNRGFVFSSVLMEAPMRGGVDGWPESGMWLCRILFENSAETKITWVLCPSLSLTH